MAISFTGRPHHRESARGPQRQSETFNTRSLADIPQRIPDPLAQTSVFRLLQQVGQRRDRFLGFGTVRGQGIGCCMANRHILVFQPLDQ
jgi:hypothetical protein